MGREIREWTNCKKRTTAADLISEKVVGLVFLRLSVQAGVVLKECRSRLKGTVWMNGKERKNSHSTEHGETRRHPHVCVVHISSWSRSSGRRSMDKRSQHLVTRQTRNCRVLSFEQCLSDRLNPKVPGSTVHSGSDEFQLKHRLNLFPGWKLSDHFGHFACLSKKTHCKT